MPMLSFEGKPIPPVFTLQRNTQNKTVTVTDPKTGESSSSAPKTLWEPLVDKITKRPVPICTDRGHDSNFAYSVEVNIHGCGGGPGSLLSRLFSPVLGASRKSESDFRFPLAHARDPVSGALLYENHLI